MAIDHVAWVRRANSRWVVHHGLEANTESYLDHLAEEDPERLRESCSAAYLLVQERPTDEDPKPWFYSGLFSLATAAEIRTYLSHHWLVRMSVTSSADGLAQNAAGHAVSDQTLRKIHRIREAVARIRARA
jgi:hypothetical protein